MSGQEEDFYKLLGVVPTASSAIIKRRYRILSKKFHPDYGGDDKRMMQINEAYRILSDDVARAAYDQSRQTATPIADVPLSRSNESDRMSQRTQPGPSVHYTATNPGNPKRKRVSFAGYAFAMLAALIGGIVVAAASDTKFTPTPTVSAAPITTATQSQDTPTISTSLNDSASSTSSSSDMLGTSQSSTPDSQSQSSVSSPSTDCTDVSCMGSTYQAPTPPPTCTGVHGFRHIMCETWKNYQTD